MPHRERVNSRRTFLKTSLAGGGAFCLPSALAPLFAESETRGFKLGVCDWSIGKTASVECFQAAKDLGLDGVQVSLGTEKDDMRLRQPAVRQTFLAELKKSEMAIASLAIGTLNQVPYKSEAKAEVWVRDSIEACRALGRDVVLLAFFGEGDIKGDKKGTDLVVERLKKIVPEAEEKGVVLGIESWLDAREHVDIIDRVGSPNVQVYYDVANSTKMGYDIHEEIRFLGADRICEFHAKDTDPLYRDGGVDFQKVRESMDAIGYAGWVVAEGGQHLNPETTGPVNVEYLRSVFPRAGV